MSENEASDDGYSITFRDLSENRIVINKKNRKSFTSEDYEKIKQLDNVDYIVEDDVFLDGSISISRNDMSLYGNLLNIENLKGELSMGRMPKNEDEIVIKLRADSQYAKNNSSEILNKTFSVLKSTGLNAFSNEKTRDLVVVGIQYYNEEEKDYNCKFYVQNSILNELRSDINKNYSTLKILLNGKYVQYTVEPNDKVAKGKAIVDDDFKYNFKKYKILNKPINLYVDNIYYKDELNLSISNTYTKYNLKKLTGLTKYDNNKYKIFVNTDDYKSLYNKPSYQSSVFVKDVDKIEETLEQLNNLDLLAKRVTDFRVSQGEVYVKILKIIKLVVTIILIIVLFFISYLIIKLILKSRNIYYTTLRMLGATYKNVRRILDIELFANSTVSYLVLMVFIYLVKTNIIRLGYIAKLSSFLSIREYVLMYVILIAISRLVSIKFARKLFKNTAINTYNEEV